MPNIPTPKEQTFLPDGALPYQNISGDGPTHSAPASGRSLVQRQLRRKSGGHRLRPVRHCGTLSGLPSRHQPRWPLGAPGEPAVCHDGAMHQPTIRLTTDDDMRAITSQNLHLIRRLPFLYIATDEPDVMRSWGVALERTFSDFERLFPGALVAPHYDGQTASRGDLLYNGAEPAAAFMPQ